MLSCIGIDAEEDIPRKSYMSKEPNEFASEHKRKGDIDRNAFGLFYLTFVCAG